MSIQSKAERLMRLYQKTQALKGNEEEIVKKAAAPKLKQYVLQMKHNIDKYTDNLIAKYYSRSSGSYNRTGSFKDINRHSYITELSQGSMYIITYEFYASDVTVNPWGKFPGSNEWAFDAGFIHGYHGGPRPIGNGVWGWDDVPKDRLYYGIRSFIANYGKDQSFKDN